MHTLARGMCDQACRTGACQKLGLRAGLLRPAALCVQPNRVGLAARCNCGPEQAAHAAGLICLPSWYVSKGKVKEGKRNPQRQREVRVGWIAESEHWLQQKVGYAVPQQCPAEHISDQQ